MAEQMGNNNIDKKIYQYTVNMLLGGLTRDKIIQSLFEKGLNKSEANKMLNYVENELIIVKRKKGKINIITGSIILLFGIGVTILSFYLSNRGAFYILIIGAVGLGMFKLGQGLIQYFSKSPIDNF